MKKIKFTSKVVFRASRLERAAGSGIISTIYFQGEEIGNINNTTLILYCEKGNKIFDMNLADHRTVVNYVKSHAKEIWDKYDLKAKTKLAI
jgi:hypothetical protein